MVSRTGLKLGVSIIDDGEVVQQKVPTKNPIKGARQEPDECNEAGDLWDFDSSSAQQEAEFVPHLPWEEQG